VPSDHKTIDYAGLMRHLAALRSCAVVTTGRAGSDYLQALLEGHSEVVTFDRTPWFYGRFWHAARTTRTEPLVASDIIDEFVGHFIHRLHSRYDALERGDRLGADGLESVTISTAVFREHLEHFLEGAPITSRSFLLGVHGAYHLSQGRDLQRVKVMVLHTHNFVETDLFLRDFPDACVVMPVRDPREMFVSSIEHMRAAMADRDSGHFVYQSLSAIFDGAQPCVERALTYATIRLEDLPTERAMRSLAQWLGIAFEVSLQRPTWGGLDWYGDKLSRKVYDPSDQDPARTFNHWDTKLGWLDRYLINYLLRGRLQSGGYALSPVHAWDHVLVPMLSVCPLTYERRFWSLGFLMPRLRRRRLKDLNEGIGNGLYYLLRIRLFWRYWRRGFAVDLSERWLGRDQDADRDAGSIGARPQPS